jgi:hypothetical protein
MGEADIENLHKIYRICVDYAKLIDKGHNFRVDNGSFETALEFTEHKVYHPPISKNWDNHPVIICPDIIDFNKKLIIEYEEESGNRRTGAYLAKKGHGHEGDYSTKRDVRRDGLYDKHGFKLLKIWQSDDINKIKEKIFSFLNS